MNSCRLTSECASLYERMVTDPLRGIRFRLVVRGKIDARLSAVLEGMQGDDAVPITAAVAATLRVRV